MEHIPVTHDFAKIGVFALVLAELTAPPTVRDHPEWPAAMITDLTRAHHSPRKTVPILDRRHDALARSVSTETESLQ